MVALPQAENVSWGEAQDVSDDGSLIVGGAADETGDQAAIWDENGIHLKGL